MGSNYQKLFEKDYAKLTSEVTDLKKMVKTLSETISNLNIAMSQKDELIAKLILENNRLKNNNDKDSTNSGKPSSTDGFKKKIANLRPATDKKKGGTNHAECNVHILRVT